MTRKWPNRGKLSVDFGLFGLCGHYGRSGEAKLCQTPKTGLDQHEAKLSNKRANLLSVGGNLKRDDMLPPDISQ